MSFKARDVVRMFPKAGWPEGAQLASEVARKGRNKLHAKAQRSQLFPGGRLYASGAERIYGEQLKLRALGGDLRDLVEQPRVWLLGTFWKVDFRYIETETGLLTFDEVKGKDTAEYLVKRGFWPLFGPARLRIIKHVGGEEFRVERVIVPDYDETRRIVAAHLAALEAAA